MHKRNHAGSDRKVIFQMALQHRKHGGIHFQKIQKLGFSGFYTAPIPLSRALYPYNIHSIPSSTPQRTDITKPLIRQSLSVAISFPLTSNPRIMAPFPSLEDAEALKYRGLPLSNDAMRSKKIGTSALKTATKTLAPKLLFMTSSMRRECERYHWMSNFSLAQFIVLWAGFQTLINENYNMGRSHKCGHTPKHVSFMVKTVLNHGRTWAFWYVCLERIIQRFNLWFWDLFTFFLRLYVNIQKVTKPNADLWNHCKSMVTCSRAIQRLGRHRKTWSSSRSIHLVVWKKENI